MNHVPQPIQVPLTPEQELTPELESPASGAGEGLRFRWRLSVATGIPRQHWVPDGDPAPGG